jgi:hypothetical protein
MPPALELPEEPEVRCYGFGLRGKPSRRFDESGEKERAQERRDLEGLVRGAEG